MNDHLRRCARCQGVLERVDAVQAALRLPVPEPDELSWRRMESRLRRALDERGETYHLSLDLDPASFPFPADPPSSHTVDVIRGRRWLVAGLAAAVVVAGFIALSPRSGGRLKPVESPTGPTPRTAVIRSGGASLALELRSGHRLDLDSWTDVSLPAPDAAPPRIELDHGKIGVRVPLPLASTPAPPVLVRTPEIDVFAQSADFSVAYQAGQHHVEVRQGHADVEGQGWQARVREGEDRAFRTSYEGPAEPQVAAIDRMRSVEDGPAKTLPAVAPKVPAEVSPVEDEARPKRWVQKGPRRRSLPTPPSRVGPSDRQGADATDTAEGKTEVERLSPVHSVLDRALVDARKAWYVARDARLTVQSAEQVIRGSRDPLLVVPALELACDARISLSEGEAAARTCGALLDHVQDPGRRRRIHYTLATMYRNHLKDCRKAVEHYGKALVFGGRTHFDDTVRLHRAECALRLGDRALARSDLEGLEGRMSDSKRVRRAYERLDTLEKAGLEGTDEHE